MNGNTLNNSLKGYKLFFKYTLKTIPIFILLSLFGCKVKKQLVNIQTRKDSTVKVANEHLKKLEAINLAQTKFDTFNGKAHAKINLYGNTNDVTLNIHIKSGQMIWVSVTAFANIEVARALITPDSIKVLNKLQGNYMVKPFSYVNSIAGNQINYNTLEAVFIGNIIPGLIIENTALETKNDSTTVTGNLDNIFYSLLLGPNLKASSTDLKNQEAGQSLSVVNTNFTAVVDKLVPAQIEIKTILKDKKIQLNLRYIKTEFGQVLDFPFNIPERYNQVN